jgi:predicted RNA-binding protein with PIN domain
MAMAPEDRGEDAAAASDPASAAVWLVDGFNVLCAGLLGGRDRSAFWTEAARREVLERAAQFDDPDARIVVVFDGPRPAEAPDDASGPETVFAPSADAWILSALGASGADPVTVVTADRRLAGRARHRGAEVIAPRVFLARCPGTAS